MLGPLVAARNDTEDSVYTLNNAKRVTVTTRLPPKKRHPSLVAYLHSGSECVGLAHIGRHNSHPRDASELGLSLGRISHTRTDLNRVRVFGRQRLQSRHTNVATGSDNEHWRDRMSGCGVSCLFSAAPAGLVPEGGGEVGGAPAGGRKAALFCSHHCQMVMAGPFKILSMSRTSLSSTIVLAPSASFKISKTPST